MKIPFCGNYITDALLQSGDAFLWYLQMIPESSIHGAFLMLKSTFYSVFGVVPYHNHVGNEDNNYC